MVPEGEHASTTFRLRHLNSGQHLIVKPAPDSTICLAGNKDEEDGYYDNEYLENTLFTLESQSVDPDERLKPSIVVKFKHVVTGTYISTATSIERPQTSIKHIGNVEEHKGGKDDTLVKNSPFKLNVRSAIDTDIAKHHLESNEYAKDEDAFVIEQTLPHYIKECLSIHAALPLLKEYVWDIRMGRDEKLRNKDRMRKIENLLTEIIFFVTETESNDPFT